MPVSLPPALASQHALRPEGLQCLRKPRFVGTCQIVSVWVLLFPAKFPTSKARSSSGHGLGPLSIVSSCLFSYLDTRISIEVPRKRGACIVKAMLGRASEAR